jgi:hypothetical protein
MPRSTVLLPPSGTGWYDDPTILGLIGCKARGLSLFPAEWRPPFVVLTSEAHARWAASTSPADVVAEAASAVIQFSQRLSLNASGMGVGWSR